MQYDIQVRREVCAGHAGPYTLIGEVYRYSGKQWEYRITALHDDWIGFWDSGDETRNGVQWFTYHEARRVVKFTLSDPGELAEWEEIFADREKEG